MMKGFDLIDNVNFDLILRLFRDTWVISIYWIMYAPVNTNFKSIYICILSKRRYSKFL